MSTRTQAVRAVAESDQGKRHKKREAFAAIVGLIAILGALYIAASSANNQAQSSSAAAQSAAPDNGSAPAAQPQAAPEPPPPSHNYAMQEGGEYGYQPGISDDERNRGVVTKALVMIRYRGLNNGTYTVEMSDGSAAVDRMQCSDLCKFVKSEIIANGQVVATQTVPNTPGSLMYAVFEDVISGQLQPH